jgi:hypothetical protein
LFFQGGHFAQRSLLFQWIFFHAKAPHRRIFDTFNTAPLVDLAQVASSVVEFSVAIASWFSRIGGGLDRVSRALFRKS